MNRFKTWVIALISSLLLAVGFIYAARGLTDIYDKDTDIKTIIADGGLASVVSFIVVVLLCELAIVITTSHPDIETAKDAKSVVISKITPNQGKGHRFCTKKNEMNREKRIAIVKRKYFLTLEAYDTYAENGGYKNKTLTLKEKLKYKQMEKLLRKVNFDDYDFDEVLNGISKPELKKPKRFTINAMRLKKYGKKILTSIATGMIFGYYGLMLAKEPNWGMVIYLAIQFIVFVANGMIQYFMTRSDILSEYKDQIKADTNLLYEFDSSLSLHPEWYVEEVIVKKPEIIDIIPETKEVIVNEPISA